jgi:3-oxoacyl-[acyl-carrier protein] reductase
MSDELVLMVTGPTGALGGPVVRRLVSAGHQLVLTSRDGEKLGAITSEYDERSVLPVTADVSDAEQAGRAATAAVEHFGRLDGLVHLIGGFHAGPVATTGTVVYQRMIEANLLSAVTATQAVLPRLTDGGRLVYLSSVLATEPFGGFSAYAASKAALQAWLRALAHEVKHRGIHANLVVMTMADTPEARRQRPHLDFGQATSPEAVAKVIDFLVSPAADGLYGTVVPVLGRFEFSAALVGGPPPGAGRGGPPPGRGQ